MTHNRNHWNLLYLGAMAFCLLVPAASNAAAKVSKPYVIEDGVVDWYTFSGFRRYHSECHVCHGPAGLGSSFAPALIEPLKTMSDEDFREIVVNGREKVGVAQQSKMPALGLNPNVMCFIDDIFAYLKARADGVLGRGRPKKRSKPAEAKERDDECMP